MPTKSNLHVIQSADLARFASALFQATGVARPMADEWAKSLVWANLRGVDSHGVLRIPTYLPRLQRKTINPKPKMRVEKRAGSIAVLEADRAPGAVAMAMAMDEAIARAREVHIGWCAAKNITHAGAVGYFSHRRVMNIDGVVNSVEFHDALRNGTAAEFLRCRNLGFVTTVGGRNRAGPGTHPHPP